MPPQRAQSRLLAKYGDKLRKAHQLHKDDETEFSQFGDLPPGINGIAKLAECKFDVFKNGDLKGEWFFSAWGNVVEPKVFTDDTGNVHHTEGLMTRIGPEPLCDTPDRSGRKTTAEHIAWIYNQLRLLGADTTQMQESELEETAAALKAAQPYFRFRTWKGKPSEQYPDPRTNHTWNGATEYEEQADGAPGPEGHVTDGTADGNDQQDADAEAAPTATRTSRPRGRGPTTAPAANGAGRGGKARGPRATAPPATEEPAEEPAEEPDAGAEDSGFDEFGDLDSLVERASADDEEAQSTLTDMAIKAGATEEDIVNTTSWEEVRTLIVGVEEPEADQEEAAEEPEPDPVKGNVFMYRPVDPKTRKPAKKPVECEVTAVDKKGRTCALKSLDDPKKVYQKVPWDSLIPVAEPE